MCPVSLDQPAVFELVSAGPLQVAVRISRTLNESSFSQVVTLRRGSRRVDFDTAIDWQECHKLLKVAFDVNYHAEEAVSEMQFGYTKRPNHRSRQYDFDRFEVPNHHWTALCEEKRGFAVLNDCKYGVSTLGGCIGLSLLRSPQTPDPQCDRGEQRFIYSFYAYNNCLADSGLVREGYDLNVPAETAAGARPDGSLLRIGAENIQLTALKPAEDGSGDYVIRLYESLRAATATELTLRLPCAAAELCNMLEQPGEPVAFTMENGAVTIPLHFRPFEVKTLRIKL
jgi:alpha-mannosidase